jgi:integrase
VSEVGRSKHTHPIILEPDPTQAASASIPQHTVQEFLDVYERDFFPTQAPMTQYQRRYVFAWLRREMGSKMLDEITSAHIRAWRDAMHARGYKSGTIRNYMDIFSAVLTAAVDEYEWLAVHPMAKIRKPPMSPIRVRFLSETEREALLGACQVSRNRALYPLVLLALATGARKNELLQRQWDDVDLDRGVIHLLRPKNKTPRPVPIVGMALTVLRAWYQQRRRDCPWMFPRWDGAKPVLIESAWYGALKRAGLQNFHYHDLRHTCGSYLARSGACLREIAEVLGHTNIQMSMRYVHLTMPHTTGVAQRMATNSWTRQAR